MAGNKKSVLFICLGNICRSPMAEAIFLHLINQRGVADQWTVDSAALGSWHVGRNPDRRTMKVLKENKIEYKHAARVVIREDFDKYDWVFGMDHDNISELTQRAPKGSKAKIELLGKYDPQGVLIIDDPYYGEEEGFYTCYEQCLRSCQGFLDSSK